jgi:choice-of-anchor A domain-containing protein
VSRAIVLDPTATLDGPSGTTARGGSLSYALAGAIADATAGAARAAALPPTQTLVAIAGPTTITGRGGLNVIAVPRIELSGPRGTLTLRGGPNDEFVINVAGGITLDDRAAIVLDGVPASKVLWNMTGANQLSLVRNPTSQGVFVNPSGTTQLVGGTLTGALLATNDVQITGTSITLG